jgi:predicted enzyme related to lactoylglutathione lyase
MNTAIGTSTVKRISPMLAVADMDQTLDFYTSLLGFAVIMKSPGYSIVERDGATIHFMKAADESVMDAVRGHAEIYIEVDDIQSLWEQVDAHRGSHKIRDLFDQPYGMTEFHIADPNGCLVFVGQATKQE